MIVVDGRWSGRHGIARFAREVTSRLAWRQETGARPASPTSPFDVVSPWRLNLRATDVVYSPGFNSGISRARQVVTLHDLIHLDEPAESSVAKSLYYEAILKPVVRRARTVLTVSATSEERVRRWLGDRCGVEVINVGNGCSRVFLDRPKAPVPQAGRFLYVGNLKSHKNTEVLFAALSRRPDYGLSLVTSDVARATLLADRHGVGRQVDIHRGLSDEQLAEMYTAHDAVLQPSRLEGFGLPALEALAVGRRVGYSRVCSSVKEIVGQEGIPVEADGDPDEWAFAMDGLLDAGASAVSLGQEWRDRYEWDGVATRVSRAVESLANGA